MEVIIQPTPKHAATLAARIIAHHVQARPTVTLGLASGRTMEGLYAELVALVRAGSLTLSHTTFFALDEYIGLPKNHPQSFAHFFEEHLFRHIAAQPELVHLMDGSATDSDEECNRYEALLRHVGGIDLQLLGLGEVGHIGFNEPLSALMSRTRTKTLMPATRKQNAFAFGGEDNVPRRAMTMGVGTILEARRCLLLVTGANKAPILAQAIEGPVTSQVTASALQLHPRCVVVVDEAAAGQLRNTEYYRWSFEHEPEWEEYRKG